MNCLLLGLYLVYIRYREDMRNYLIRIFLFCCFYGTPAYAATIVNVSEVLNIIEKEYLSECEWIETVEVRTTTIYRESYYEYPKPVINPVQPIQEGFTPLPVSYSGFRNPCFPEVNDENTVIPDYCFTREPGFPSSIGNAVWGTISPILLFREWSELSIHYDLVHQNQCDDCHPTLAPEPANWILGLTGLAMVLISRRLSKGKSRSRSL